jgi:23S rRNA (guanosine2251-2'-O)-methyltransferase
MHKNTNNKKHRKSNSDFNSFNRGLETKNSNNRSKNRLDSRDRQFSKEKTNSQEKPRANFKDSTQKFDRAESLDYKRKNTQNYQKNSIFDNTKEYAKRQKKDKKRIEDKKPDYTKNRHQDSKETKMLIYGKNPVLSALANQNRIIKQIFTTSNNSQAISKIAKNRPKLNNIIKIIDNDYLDNILPNKLHQGLAAEVEPLNIKNQNDLLSEIYQLQEKSQEKVNLPNLLMLDQICDPHNVGAIIRSAAAFGFTKIIFSYHNSIKESPIIVKSSCGAIELVDLYQVTNFNNLLAKLKEIGYWIVGLDGRGNIAIEKLKEYLPIVVIAGSEGDGIRSLVKKNCDFLAKITISESVESLNVSIATAIALNNIYKK